MKSAFLGGAYTLRSHPLSAQTCINLYVEPNESGSGDPGGFYGTPGKRKVLTLPAPGCRAMKAANGYVWAVYGEKVFRIGKSGNTVTHTEIGDLPNSTGPVEIQSNVGSVIIAHPGGWHAVDLATLAITQVADSPDMSDVSFIDNYVVGAASDGTYVWANLNSTVVDPLNFASAEGNPDKIVRTLADHRELWLFGTESTEVAVVTPDPDLPFTRTSYIEQGILAPRSAAKEDNSVFWLGQNEHGRGVVYVAEGYVPRRISTFAIEQAIAGYDSPEKATAYTYQQDGHHFYVICFAEATWAYDINTQLWAQRAWREPDTGLLKRDRGCAHAIIGDSHLVGDWEDGRLYVLDTSYYLDDQDRIYRERTWPQVEAENRLIRYDRGELIADMGVGLDGDPASPDADPSVWLSWSDDGGGTWSSEHERGLGRLGMFNWRAAWRRLGRARTRYFRLRTSAAVRVVWRGFNIDVSVANK